MAAIILVAALLVFLAKKNQSRPQPLAPPTAVESEPASTGAETNPPVSTRVQRFKRDALSPQQLEAFNEAFTNRLKPAFEKWSKIYAGHLAVRAGSLDSTNLLESMGRGPYSMYTFMLEGATVGIQDRNGVAQVAYLNTPEAKKLMGLPKGEAPNPQLPISHEDLAHMLEADSGVKFPPAEIRVVPSGFSTAMNGGAQISVGGDPNNIASWKFTFVFGPDGNLNYYFRGTP